MKKGYVQVTDSYERIIHWTMAISCLLLCLTGLGMMFQSFNPDFPLAHMLVYVAPRGRADALAHKPQNQARFLRGTDNSK